MANGGESDADRLSYRAARLAARLPGVSWHRYVVVAVPVAGMPALPRGFEVADGDGGLTDRGVAAFRRGQGMSALAVARPGGAALGVTWLKAGGFDEDEAHLRFEPPPGWAWDTGLFVRDAARGGRAFAALWGATRAWLEARGLAGSMSRIADYNSASRRAHLRMGGREVALVAVLGLGQRQRAWGAVPGWTRTDGARALWRA